MTTRALVVGLVAVGGVAAAIALAIAARETPAAPAPAATAATVTPSPSPAIDDGAPRTPPATATATATAAAPAGDDGAPSVEDVLRAHADPSTAGLDVLIAALDASDAVVVAEAVNALIARGAIGALPALVGYDVIGRPAAALAVIDALGRIGAVADPAERGDVLDRLLALLAAEKQRGARESQGNLLQIYEALGQLGDPRAVAPLERELLDPTVALAPKSVVVQALVALRAQGSRGALEQLAAQLEASAEGVGFEAELRRELIATIRAALVQLS